MMVERVRMNGLACFSTGVIEKVHKGSGSETSVDKEGHMNDANRISGDEAHKMNWSRVVEVPGVTRKSLVTGGKDKISVPARMRCRDMSDNFWNLAPNYNDKYCPNSYVFNGLDFVSYLLSIINKINFIWYEYCYKSGEQKKHLSRQIVGEN